MIKKSLLCVFFLALLVAPLTAVAEPEHVAKLRAAAEKGSADAQVALGILYEHGKGVPQNYKKAVRLYAQAASKRHIDGVFFLGRLLYAGRGAPQDYEAAAKVFRWGAEAGDSRAQVVLGAMYRDGVGVSQSFNEAAKWYTLAAKQGNTDAQVLLGEIYDHGWGDVLKDTKKSIKWYSAAADKGNAFAQEKLAGLYVEGKGVPVDYVLAYKWANLAAVNGQGIDGAKLRDKLTKLMTPEQIAEAQRLSREWIKAFEARKKN